MIKKILCWFGLHDPKVVRGMVNFQTWTRPYKIVCRHCGRPAGGR